tara:strand:+ start:2478 stop:3536 length:1059 start_codon:yes stop_codon:yes gene_type:complete
MQSTIKDEELVFTHNSVSRARYHGTGIRYGGNSVEDATDVMQFDQSNLKVLSNSITLGNKDHDHIPILNDIKGLVLRTITIGFTSPTDCVDGEYTSLVPYLTEIGNDGATGFGSGAVLSCSVANGVVTSIEVINSGDNYQVGNKIHVQNTEVGSPTEDVIITIQKRGKIELNGAVTADSLNITGDILVGEKSAQIGHDIVIFAQNTYFDSSYGDMSGQHRAGDIYANGNVVADSFDNTSDVRMKTNIQDMGSDVSRLLYQLRPVTYTWKDLSKNQDLKFGFLAQEVQDIYPNMVSEFSKSHLTLDYIQLIAPIVNEMKILQNRQGVISAKLKEITDMIPPPPPKPKKRVRIS